MSKSKDKVRRSAKTGAFVVRKDAVSPKSATVRVTEKLTPRASAKTVEAIKKADKTYSKALDRLAKR